MIVSEILGGRDVEGSDVERRDVGLADRASEAVVAEEVVVSVRTALPTALPVVLVMVVVPVACVLSASA